MEGSWIDLLLEFLHQLELKIPHTPGKPGHVIYRNPMGDLLVRVSFDEMFFVCAVDRKQLETDIPEAVASVVAKAIEHQVVGKSEKENGTTNVYGPADA